MGERAVEVILGLWPTQSNWGYLCPNDACFSSSQYGARVYLHFSLTLSSHYIASVTPSNHQVICLQYFYMFLGDLRGVC